MNDPKDKKQYEDDKIYHKVGNDEWISIDQFLTKDQVIKLVDLLGSYIVTMAKCQGNIGIDVTAEFVAKLEELKEELKKMTEDKEMYAAVIPITEENKSELLELALSMKPKCEVESCKNLVEIRCLFCAKDYCWDHSVPNMSSGQNRCLFCQKKLDEDKENLK